MAAVDIESGQRCIVHAAGRRCESARQGWCASLSRSVQRAVVAQPHVGERDTGRLLHLIPWPCPCPAGYMAWRWRL